MREIFDSHCHVPPRPNAPAERGDAPRDALLAGRLLCGVSPADWDSVESESARFRTAFPAFGLHPWEPADENGEWFSALEEKLAANQNAWLGEAGLDRLRTERVSFDRQKETLIRQLKLAKRLGRPVSLHCVRAWEDILPLLDRHYLHRSGGRSGFFIMHAFSGPPPYVKALASRGACFSIGTAILNPSFRRQRECALAIPDDRLLVESDAYVGDNGDGLADLAAVINELANLRVCPPGHMAELILGNSRRVFFGNG